MRKGGEPDFAAFFLTHQGIVLTLSYSILQEKE